MDLRQQTCFNHYSLVREEGEEEEWGKEKKQKEKEKRKQDPLKTS